MTACGRRHTSRAVDAIKRCFRLGVGLAERADSRSFNAHVSAAVDWRREPLGLSSVSAQ